MKKVLVGNGGHAREVMAQMGLKLDRFVDDQYVDDETFPISKLNPEKHAVMIAVANSKDRFDIMTRLPKGIYFFNFIHPTALIMDNVEIGEGSFIGAYSMPGVIVSGDVIIGDVVYMGTNSSIREKLTIHSLCTIGMNSAVVKHIEQPGVYVGCPSKLVK